VQGLRILKAKIAGDFRRQNCLESATIMAQHLIDKDSASENRSESGAVR